MIKRLIAFLAAVMTMATQTVTVEYITEYAPAGTNPHKGWTIYTYSHWDLISDEYGVGNSVAWEESELIYTRVPWHEVVSEDGTYNWNVIDTYLEQCVELDKKLAFGVIPSNSLVDDVNGYVPGFVYEDGCDHVMAKTEHGYQRTPEWDDKVYIRYAKELADALAERYDGDPNIEYIDIRSFGNWGEWHTYGLDGSEMPSDKVQMDMLQHWADAFKQTQLVVPVNSDRPTAVSQYAVDIGITLRRDGLMQLVGHEKALQPAVEAKLPVVGEFCSGYVYMKDNGYWSDDYLREMIDTVDMTYLQMGDTIREGAYMWEKVPEFMAEITELLGYTYTVTKAELSRTGDTGTLTIAIENLGVAPQYFPLYIQAGTGNGGEISPIGDAVLIPEAEFAGGTIRTFVLELPSDELGEILYIGAFEAGEKEPNVRFANKNIKQGWLELGGI